MEKLIYLLLLVGFIACSSEEEPVRGCIDPDSDNYNPNATEDNGSCTYLRDIYLGSYDGELGGCTPDNDSNNFSDPKSVVIQPADNSDEVKVIINDISVQDFREKKVMTFIGRVTEDELIFNNSESSDRFVLGEMSIRVILNGTMSRSSSGNLSGRMVVDVFDTGTANVSLELYNCDLTFTR